jgi:hypothetical protein
MALRSSRTVSFLNDLSSHVVNGMTSRSNGCSETSNGHDRTLCVGTHLLPDATLSATEDGENCYIKYYYHYRALRRFPFS